MGASRISEVHEYDIFAPVRKRSSETRPLIVVQARMGSTRLPGKILKEVEGKPLLRILMDRLRDVEKPFSLLVATTTLEKDDATVHCVERAGVSYFRGEEEDVLDRFWGASRTCSCDAIVRLTADCPLTDPWLVSKALDLFYSLNVDYLSNTLRRTFPRGFDIEIFKVSALVLSAREAHSPYEREHVTPYIVQHPEIFSQACFTSPEDFSGHRVTVDTVEDFSFVKKIVSLLGCSSRTCSFTTVEELLRQHPEWAREYVIS